jgi:hypothetical protein
MTINCIVRRVKLLEMAEGVSVQARCAPIYSLTWRAHQPGHFAGLS